MWGKATNGKEKQQELTATAFGPGRGSDTCEMGGEGRKKLRNGPALTHCSITVWGPPGWMESNEPWRPSANCIPRG